MRLLLTAAVFALSVGCYPLRWARFVDDSQDTAPAWLRVRDDEPGDNPTMNGIQCGDLRSFQVDVDEPVIRALPADAGVTTVLARELPRDPETDVDQL